MNRKKDPDLLIYSWWSLPIWYDGPEWLWSARHIPSGLDKHEDNWDWVSRRRELGSRACTRLPCSRAHSRAAWTRYGRRKRKSRWYCDTPADIHRCWRRTRPYLNSQYHILCFLLDNNSNNLSYLWSKQQRNPFSEPSCPMRIRYGGRYPQRWERVVSGYRRKGRAYGARFRSVYSALQYGRTRNLAVWHFKPKKKLYYNRLGFHDAKSFSLPVKFGTI